MRGDRKKYVDIESTNAMKQGRGHGSSYGCHDQSNADTGARISQIRIENRDSNRRNDLRYFIVRSAAIVSIPFHRFCKRRFSLAAC